MPATKKKKAATKARKTRSAKSSRLSLIQKRAGAMKRKRGYSAPSTPRARAAKAKRDWAQRRPTLAKGNRWSEDTCKGKVCRVRIGGKEMAEVGVARRRKRVDGRIIEIRVVR